MFLILGNASPAMLIKVTFLGLTAFLLLPGFRIFGEQKLGFPSLSFPFLSGDQEGQTKNSFNKGNIEKKKKMG